MAILFNKGEELKVVNTKPFPGNKIAPRLDKEKTYKLEDTYICQCGERHLDVGLRNSSIGQVTCHKCREVLPGSAIDDGEAIIHWAHASRFVSASGRKPTMAELLGEEPQTEDNAGDNQSDNE